MGIKFRKQISLGKHLKANVSKSGVSFSFKAGPLTINSKGRKSVNLPGGFYFTKTKKKK